MQYHLNGFRSGDPSVAEACDPSEGPADAVDVLIIGCGPAGLTLAAQLSAFADIRVCIAERKEGPLDVGQADGIACRSIEIFQAFGFAEDVVREAYQVNEVTFWRPDADEGRLTRVDRIQDVEDDLSEMPHVILNQARVHDFYLARMAKGPQRLVPRYRHDLQSVTVSNDADYPVIATFDHAGQTETIRARYLVGCDGARSTVRRAMGLHLEGEAARQLWGVMDILAVTDFPDIRLKCAIQSAGQGSLLIIPREGGYMVRMYIELDSLAEGERAADRDVSPRMLTEKAQAILAPYSLDVKEVAWWSAYEIGQRVCTRFDDVPDPERSGGLPRLFIAGDACHTHSPKAGQGMNVSMADAFNLGWKLAMVLRGQADPRLLLSYSEERQAKARELIDFDRDMARLFSARPKTPDEAATFQRYFQKHGRYTAGVETRYDPSLIVGDGAYQALARELIIGKRFHSAEVIRLADAKPMHLGHVIAADGRWRLFAFAGAGDHCQADAPVAKLCHWLAGDPESPLLRYAPKGADPDCLFDLRAVFQADHRSLEITDMPALLRPAKGRYRLVDYEKVFCDKAFYDLRGIDRVQGALLLVRPDQFVADVLPLNGTSRLTAFFDCFLQHS